MKCVYFHSFSRRIDRKDYVPIQLAAKASCMTFRPAIALLLGAMLASAGGCRTHRPVFGPQGTVYHQRLDAAVFDPFVDNQAGPEVVGGRPRTFQQPWSEAQRSQTLRGG